MPDELLEIISDAGLRIERPIESSVLLFGRSVECDVQLDGPGVSRRHAELSRSGDHQWRIRDLQSRNGTLVNGHAMTEQAVTSADAIQIAGFSIRIIRPGEKKESAHSNATVWMPERSDTTHFMMLRAAREPRLNSDLLQSVNGLSKQLAEIALPRERMNRLCRMLVDSEIACASAVVVKYARGAGAPPAMLCDFAMARQAGASIEPPAIMRAVIDAAVASEQPVLAGGMVHSGLTVMFDQSQRGVMAALACPINIETNTAELLYATLPHEAGTVDWLAVVALAAEQFRKSELQLEARQNSQASALLQHELAKARKIQMQLVPHRIHASGLDIAIGFEPCLWVGGDYVNVMPAPSGEVLLAVADVSGKGLPAAMVATGVHSIVHASIRSGVGLSEMARRLNEYLLESLDLQSFVTMIGVMFNPTTGAAQLVNAGHLPPLVINRAGASRDIPISGNAPLGVMPMTADISEIKLSSDELLILYTDGLSELYDRDHKMIGVEGVTAIVGRLYAENPEIALDQLRDRLNAELDSIRGTPTATDDRTFLLARRKA